MIKAIETIYNGYKFRSRLEARWAVFFDSAGIRYEYEPEGYDLGDAGYYLPDFWLPDIGGRAKRTEDVWGNKMTGSEKGIFVEVKGDMTEKDYNKILKFYEEVDKILVVGQLPNGDVWNIKERNNYYTDSIYFNFATIDGDCYWAAFNKANNGDVELWGGDNDKAGNYGRGYDDFDGFNYFLPHYDKARQARFEHGECGK